MTSRAVILIIVHRPELRWWEEISLRQCARVFACRPVHLVCPAGMDVSAYRRIAPNLVVDFIPPRWLADYTSFNRLKILPFLYRRYARFEFILFYELDAFVFADDLDRWCDRGWDYIGAPLFTGYLEAVPDAAPVADLNGGLSLRRTASMLRVSRTLRYQVPPAAFFSAWRAARNFSPGALLFLLGKLTFRNNFLAPLNDYFANEDVFWCSRAAPRFPWFRLAPYEAAREFAFEANAPRLHCELGDRLPFGCHKWATHHVDFWRPIIESFGHRYPASFA